MDDLEIQPGIIKDRILELMTIKNIDAANLSDMIHLPRTTINHIIYGLSAFPRADTLWKLAHCLGVPIEYILGKTPSIVQNIIQEGKSSCTLDHGNACQKIPILTFDLIRMWFSQPNTMMARNDVLWMHFDKLNESSFALKIDANYIPIVSRDSIFQKDNVVVVENKKEYQPSDIVVVAFKNLKPTIRQIVDDSGIKYLMPISAPLKIEPMSDQTFIFGKIIKIIKSLA